MQKIVRIVLTLLRQTYDSLPIDFYLVPKRKSVLEMSKTVLSWQCPPDMKKRSSRRNSPGRRPRRYLQLDHQTLYTEKWDLSILSTSYMTQCYDMHESVSTYTNYNHYESTILELSHFKKSGDYGNETRRYRCLDCGKAFSPLTGILFDANKIPISEWIEYMIHLFEFHSLSSAFIKEDMDFLKDIDKESLTDAPDTRISTSMSFKVKNKEVKIETTQKYNRFDI